MATSPARVRGCKLRVLLSFGIEAFGQFGVEAQHALRRVAHGKARALHRRARLFQQAVDVT